MRLPSIAIRKPAMAAVAAALFAVCTALAGPSLASDSSDQQSPDLDSCKSIWTNSSAADTCVRNLTVDTEQALCRVTVDCPRGGTYQATSTVGAGCYLRDLGMGNYEYLCTNTVTYEDEDDTELVNCSAELRVASDCSFQDSS